MFQGSFSIQDIVSTLFNFESNIKISGAGTALKSWVGKAVNISHALF